MMISAIAHLVFFLCLFVIPGIFSPKSVKLNVYKVNLVSVASPKQLPRTTVTQAKAKGEGQKKVAAISAPKPEAKTSPAKKEEPKKPETKAKAIAPGKTEKPAKVADEDIEEALKRARERLAMREAEKQEGEGGEGAIPEAAQVESGEGASGVASIDQPGEDAIMNAYLLQVHDTIKSKWTLFDNTRYLNSTATYTIRISQDGKIISITQEKSSGDVYFDQSVLMAIKKSIPLPPPPQDLSQELATNGLGINFSLQELTKR